MKIAVFGASSSIAQSLFEHWLQDSDFRIVRFGRSPDVLGSRMGAEFYKYELGQDIAIDTSFKAVIFCAYDFHDLEPSDENINVKAIEKIEFGEKTKFIYISSVLAENTFSLYGNVKSLIEKHILEKGGIVVRVGFLYSNPPISNLSKLFRAANFVKVLLLPGANTHVLVTHLKSFVEVISGLISEIPRIKKDDAIFVIDEVATIKDLLHRINPKLKIMNLPILPFVPILFLIQKTRFAFFSDKFLNLAIPVQKYSSYELLSKNEKK